MKLHLNVMLVLFSTLFKKDAWHVQMGACPVMMSSLVRYVVLISTTTQHLNYVHSFVEMEKDI